MTDDLEDYLTEYARERQKAATNYHVQGGDRCRTCPHVWHGVQCSNAGCTCAASWKESA